MKLTVRNNSSGTIFSYLREGDDRVVAGRATMAHSDFRVDVDLGDSHGDIVNLIGMLAVFPWLGTRFESERPVSAEFADVVRKTLGIDVANVDDELRSRSQPINGRVGLAYSGGADCTAAAALLRDHVAAYFLDRVPRPGGVWTGLYNKEAAVHALVSLSEHVETVRSVHTDLEFLRDPVGFPHDLANIIPALCYADRDGLDGVAWGAILESTYRVGAKRYRDYAASPFLAQIGPLLNAVGLPVVNPVAGVSEVGTAIINVKSGFGSFAQSCMRGSVGSPCLRCWKCARKVILDSALSAKWWQPDELDELLGNREARIRFLDEPIKHEIVVAFSVNRFAGLGINGCEIMDALHVKLGTHDVEFLQRHYSPALALLPDSYLDIVRDRLNGYLEPMTRAEEENLSRWTVAPHLDSDGRAAANARLAARFSELDEGK